MGWDRGTAKLVENNSATKLQLEITAVQSTDTVGTGANQQKHIPNAAGLVKGWEEERTYFFCRNCDYPPWNGPVVAIIALPFVTLAVAWFSLARLWNAVQILPKSRVELRKADGGVRNLGVSTVVDRFVQQADAQVLTSIYEKQFHDHSYGFRPNQYAEQAILKALEMMNDKKDWIGLCTKGTWTRLLCHQRSFLQ